MKIKEIIREKGFRVFVVEFNGNVGFIVEYRGKSYYISSILTDERIVLPLKYREYFDPVLFPEIVFVPYGRVR